MGPAFLSLWSKNNLEHTDQDKKLDSISPQETHARTLFQTITWQEIHRKEVGGKGGR
jgi:hypothetical protein